MNINNAEFPILYRGITIRTNQTILGSYVQGGHLSKVDYIYPIGSSTHCFEVSRDSVSIFTGKYDSTTWEELTEDQKEFWCKLFHRGSWKGIPVFSGDKILWKKYTWSKEKKDMVYQDVIRTVKWSDVYSCFMPFKDFTSREQFKVIETHMEDKVDGRS